jgi:hypothetical protein
VHPTRSGGCERSRCSPEPPGRPRPIASPTTTAQAGARTTPPHGCETRRNVLQARSDDAKPENPPPKNGRRPGRLPIPNPPVKTVDRGSDLAGQPVPRRTGVAWTERPPQCGEGKAVRSLLTVRRRRATLRGRVLYQKALEVGVPRERQHR